MEEFGEFIDSLAAGQPSEFGEFIRSLAAGQTPIPKSRFGPAFRDAYGRSVRRRAPASRAEAIGQALGRVLAGALVGALVGVLGGPTWAAVGFAVVTVGCLR